MPPTPPDESMQADAVQYESAIPAQDQFFGRGQEIRRVIENIVSHPARSTSIVGGRYTGKSSLLWHLSRPETYSGNPEIPDTHRFLLQEFYGRRFKFCEQAEIVGVLIQGLAQLVPPSRPMPESTDLSALGQLVQDMCEAGLRLVCVLDYFDNIMDNPNIGREFFDFLHGLVVNESVVFITSSKQQLPFLCRTGEIAASAFFSLFDVIALGSMQADEVRTVSQQPTAPAALRSHEEEIRRLSGDLPVFLQMAAGIVQKYTDEAGRTALGPPDWRKINRRFGKNARPFFRDMWRDLSKGHRAILKALVRGPSLPSHAPEDLQVLKDWGYVRRADGDRDGYALFSEPFAEYARRRFALGRVARGGSLGAALLLVVLALGIALAPSGKTRGVVSSAAGFHYRSRVDASAGELTIPLPHSPRFSTSQAVLKSGDRYRLSFEASGDCHLYAYRMDPGRDLVQWPDSSSSTPVSLRGGDSFRFPEEADSWLQARGQEGLYRIWIFASESRDRELEEIYQRLRQASQISRVEYRRKFAQRMELRCQEGSPGIYCGQVGFRHDKH